jgi:hypothetical protein
MSYADANYAKCEDTRRSISGGLNTIGGTVTNWYSKKQETVALSSSEAELNSYAMCCQEAIFQNMLLKELLNEEPKTAIIFEDNMGCIFLVKNQRVSSRTKHVDIKTHFVRDHYERGNVLPSFVRSESMMCDGMTKNQAEQLFRQHRNDIRLGNLSCRREDVRSTDGLRTDTPKDSYGNSNG